jgi:ribosomal protein S18 acetylase RimI-like enzyme
MGGLEFIMVIRDILPGDREVVWEMVNNFYTGTGACLHPLERENFDLTFKECLKKEKTYARMLVIEGEEEICGYCILALTWSNEAGGMVVWVEELYFTDKARGKGYGRAVFAWLEHEYPQAKRFRLEATAENEGAIRLYERLGYEKFAYYQMIKEIK